MAILKILKTKSTTLSDDLFLCQVSKEAVVRFEFNIFCTLVTMATAAILNLFNPPKAATHYGGYSYKVLWSLMKGSQQNFNPPLFGFHGNCGKVCPTDSDFFLAYLVPLDVVPYKFHQFLFGKEPVMIIFVFFNFLAFWPFPWQRQPFRKFQK